MVVIPAQARTTVKKRVQMGRFANKAIGRK